MKKLIGFIPIGIQGLSYFAIPVYRDQETSEYEYHILSEDLKLINGFESTNGIPEPMITLPNSLQKEDIKEGDPAIFVIEAKTKLFAGNAKEIMPHINEIQEISGKNFNKELKILESTID